MQKRIISLVLCLVTFVTTISVGFAQTRVSAASPNVIVMYENEETAEVDVAQNDKKTITAKCEYAKDYDLQWQVLVDIKSNLWVDIHGQTEEELALSYPLLSNALDSDASAYVRAAAIVGGEKYYSESVLVNIVPSTEKSSLSLNPKAKMAQPAPLADEIDPDADEGLADVEYVYIRVNYLDAETKEPIYNSYTSRIEKGTAFSQTVICPTWLGFAPFYNENDIATDDPSTATKEAPRIRVSVTGDETEEKVYNIYYKPMQVPYAAKFFYQNLYDNLYSEDSSRYFRSTALTGEIVGDDLLNSHGDKEGFSALYHYPEAVAADGSTVFECYYDRNYYLINFDLNGGWGAEPIYARYGTPFLTTDPVFAGYEFLGWDLLDENGNGDGIPDALPTTIPAENLTYRAMWDIKTVRVTYAFWIESPNGDGKYTYVASISENLSPDKFPDGTISASQADLDKFTDVLPDMKYFHFSRADENVKVKNDGTTLVNIYCDRNRYNARFIFAAEDINGNRTYVSSNSAQTDDYATAFGKASDGAKTLQAWKDFVAGADYFDENGKRYFYFELKDLKYEQSILDLWPSGGQYPGTENGNPPRVNQYNDGKNTWKFVGWTPAPDAPYHTTNKNNPVITGLYEDFKMELIPLSSVADPTKPADFVMSTTKSDKTNTFSYYFQKPGFPATPIDDTNYELKYQYTIPIDSGNGNQHGGTYNGFNKVKEESSGNGVNMWYERLSYNVEVHSYKNTGEFIEEAPDAYNRTLQYEAPLDIYLTGDGTLPDITVPPYPSNLEENSYTFDGYYTNPVFAPGTELKIGDTMPSENIILYAKWTPIKHNVKFFLSEDKWKEGTDIFYEDDVPHRSTIVADDEVLIPTHPDNNVVFAGWFYYENGVKKAYTPRDIPVIKDMEVFAEWSSKVAQPYKIQYVLLKDPTVHVAPDSTGFAYQGSTRTFTAKAGAPFNELYPQYNQGYFPTLATHSITMQPDDKFNPTVNVWTFYYIQADELAYRVEYRDAATNEELADAKEATTKYAVITERFKPIAGYVPDNFYKRLVIQVDPENPTDPSKNVIIFYYTKNEDAKIYAVHYMFQKPGTDGINFNPPETNGDFVEKVLEEGLTTDDSVFIEPNEQPGYELHNEAYERIEGDPDNPNALSLENGGFTINTVKSGTDLYVYYLLKDYPYVVKYLEYGTGKVLAEEKIGEAQFSTDVTEQAIDIPGYFCIPPYEKTITIAYDETPNDGDYVNEIIFYYQSLQYTVEYKVWNQGGGTVIPEIETFIPGDEEVGELQGSDPIPDYGYVFEGWFLDPECKIPATTNGKAAVDDSGHILPDEKQLSTQEHANVFYAKFTKQLSGLTIDRNNAENEGEGEQVFVYHVTNVETGEVITVTVTGNGQRTITDLKAGEYIVEQDNDWSWRFSDEPKRVTVTIDGNTTVVFDDDATDPYWLNGNSAPVKNVKSKEADL